MKTVQLIRVSIEDWRERLRRLTTLPDAADDGHLWWRTLDESVVGRGAAAARAAVGRATSDSQAARIMNALRTPAPIQRMQFAGVATMAAALVHIALMLPRGMVGFWWLILPALALVFGALAGSGG